MEPPIDAQDGADRESERLVRSFLADDKRAFDELVRLHKRFVFNLCYRLLGDYDDADDCAQDVFVKVFRSVEDFRFESSFKTWLYRVTVNACKSRLRSVEYRLRSRRIRLDTTNEKNGERVDVANHTRSPAASVQREEIGRLIQEAMGHLPADQKTAVVLRDVEGRSYEEIVEIMAIPLGTLKSKLSRARNRLRELLEGTV